jgi:2-polyprenyl-3-methyl-5-hydroxy-6-metoxy-1,4-benzoquinol methylase
MTMNPFEPSMWDERYSTDGYLFGTDPAAFLARNAGLLTPGATTLVVADGEGRNSVFLAEQGLDVTAMDVSSVGVDKARRLAAERRVSVDFRLADILAWEWAPEAYDVVVAVFIQFLTPQQRVTVFSGLQRTLRPGGLLLLHGYRPEQVHLGTGGPSDPDHMYTEALLAEAFADLEIEVLHSYDAVITEGAGHAGTSALIDLVARKR